MAESGATPDWLETLLSDTNAGIYIFDLGFKDNNDSQEPLQPLTNYAGPSATTTQQEELMMTTLQLDNVSKPPPAAVHQHKPAFQTPKSSKPRRVRSDTARRMEIARLKLELSKLEAHIDKLMNKAVTQSDEQSSLHKCQLVNEKLRELTRHQQLWIARGLSVSSFMATQCSATLFSYNIHLRREISDRVKTLSDMRAYILRDGRETLREQMHFLSGKLLPFKEESSSTAAEGDMHASSFAATQIEGTTSVKEVFGALRSVLTSNMDIMCQKTKTRSKTEVVDVHPILDQSGITHCLRMRWSPMGGVTEFNGVLFSEYQGSPDSSEQLDKHAHATIAIHPVEEDWLYPYTSGRMRLDVTSIISIHHTEHFQGCEQRSSQHSSDITEGVVIVRNTFIKLRCGGVSIPASELQKVMNYEMLKDSAALEAVMELFARQ